MEKQILREHHLTVQIIQTTILAIQVILTKQLIEEYLDNLLTKDK